MNPTIQALVNAGKIGWVNDAVGAGILNQERANVQHPYDRMFVRNDSNLAGNTVTFFQVPIAGSYTILNSAVQHTKTLADTNWDQANQAQYSYLLTGMYFKVGTLDQQMGLAAPNDLTTWPDLLRAILEDSTLEIVSEDNTLMRQKAVHVPEGNATYGVTSITGTPANAVVVGQSVVSNGLASAGNIFGFGRMALFVPKGTRFNVKWTFGASLLAASAAYKPASAKIFGEVRFQGVKFQPVG